MPRRRTNRRRRSLAAAFLPLALLGLFVELGIALWVSPRFQVKQVMVTGNRLASRARVLKRLNLPARAAMVRCAPGPLERNIETEPLIRSARVRRRWPDILQVEVTERAALVTMRVGSQWWEVDASGIAFRAVGAPAPGVPQVFARDQATLKLGDVIAPARLAQLKAVLGWSKEHPEFRLASVALEPGGKLCLNSDGGMPVRLGTPVELRRKLETLSKLVADYPEIRAGYDIAYVNLYAWDAPAVRPKKAVPASLAPLL
jgi:cell division protein FtsQ